MSSINKKVETIKTHEGGNAKTINNVQQLRRSVMSCMLWEKSFYEDGESIADRIKNLCQAVDNKTVKSLAIEAKYDMGIRHTPLWMAVSAGIYDKEFIKKIIRRPDDMMELLSMYWLNGRKSIPKQMKLAFIDKLNELDHYQLSKYKGGSKAVKLRDIIRLVHPKPIDNNHDKWFAGVVNGDIEPPDTWENALMNGADKKETFERLIKDSKLGALAFLRNLRNMRESGVKNIREGLQNLKCNKILPFQFIQAAKYAPDYEDVIEIKMIEAVQGFGKLKGKTILLVDVSGSMSWPLSDKSDITRSDCAGGVAIMAREVCENISCFAFGTNIYEIPNRRGFALSEQVKCRNKGTQLGGAVAWVNKNLEYDRFIVITDEQSHDSVPDPKEKGYLINVSCEQNGVGYYSWMHIDGWSPAVIKYILEYENDSNNLH